MCHKIDATGNYLEFPGVTIIAPIVKASQGSDLLHRIHQSLARSTLVTRYYAPLPYDSYHMTTCNLYTKSGCTLNWFKFITDRLEFFQNLCAQLKIHEFTPEILIESVQVGGALQLCLSLPESQKKMIKELAQSFGIDNGIPYFFHITLAYGYKNIDDETVHQEIIATVRQIIAPCIHQKIKLAAPTLCSFESMEAFTPWDGITYPFNHDSRTKRAKRFFGYGETPSSTVSSEGSCTGMHV